MPKAFSDDEKTVIRDRLMAAGLKRFQRQGIRAMRVDDLCREVGIAKGSFYAFFPNKEALFFALADQHDERHKAEMMAEMRGWDGSPSRALASFFDMVMLRLETDPLIEIVQDTGDLAYAMRHAPPGYVADNQARDRAFVKDMAALFAERFGPTHIDAEMLEGVMTIMVALRMQADYLKSTDTYTPTVALLRDMFLKRAIEGPAHD